MPVACFLGRGRIHILMNAPSMGVDMRILFVVVGYRNSIYSVHQTQKAIHPFRGGVLFARVRDSKVESKLPVAAWAMPAGRHRNNNFLRSRKCKRIPAAPRRLTGCDGLLSDKIASIVCLHTTAVLFAM